MDREKFVRSIWEDRFNKGISGAYKDHKVFVNNGTYYTIGEEDPKCLIRGFGGRKARITFKDGTVVNSTNLWCGGDIPEAFAICFKPFEAKLEWVRNVPKPVGLVDGDDDLLPF